MPCRLLAIVCIAVAPFACAPQGASSPQASAAGTHPATAPASGATSAPASQPTPEDFAGPAGGFRQDVKTGAINNVRLDGTEEANAWFHLSVPPNYTPAKAWPLMIVLHGGPGGNGPNDIVSFFRGGLQAGGVISVYPNGIKQQLLEWNYPHSGAYLIAIIHQVAATYRIDSCRIYLVGVSMGGGGTWCQGAILRDIWAGLGPIAGWYGPTPAPPAAWLKDARIYCLHGGADTAVPSRRSRLAVEEMKKVGHKVLALENLATFAAAGEETMVYREVPGGQHNVLLPWQQQGAVELGKMMGWLLSHRRAVPADLPAAQKALAAWGKQFGWRPTGVLGEYDAATTRPQLK